MNYLFILKEPMFLTFTYAILLFLLGAVVSALLVYWKQKQIRALLEHQKSTIEAALEYQKQITVTDLENQKTLHKKELDLINEVNIRLEQSKKTLEEKNEQMQIEKSSIAQDLALKISELNHLTNKYNEKEGEIKQIQDQFKSSFENLANNILEKKAATFTNQNKENIENILKPLGEKIKEFQDRVENTDKESIRRHTALGMQIQNLSELNKQISQEAENLTKALKGSAKVQGNWGEMVLSRVLEISGLEKGREYIVQDRHITEQGQVLIPDAVIMLPENKRMVVDAKVSLTSYERYVNEQDPDLQKKHLNEHLTSIKRHVEQLSSKNYQTLFDGKSPDFVLLFIPIESAYAVAMSINSELHMQAYNKKIIIVTPNTILTVLGSINTMWQTDKQSKNTLEIARQAGNLYDKFVGFIEDLNKVGAKMDDAKNIYTEAMKKLHAGSDNLVRKVEKLKELGVKTNKLIPQKNLDRAQ